MRLKFLLVLGLGAVSVWSLSGGEAEDRAPVAVGSERTPKVDEVPFAVSAPLELAATEETSPQAHRMRRMVEDFKRGQILSEVPAMRKYEAELFHYLMQFDFGWSSEGPADAPLMEKLCLNGFPAACEMRRRSAHLMSTEIVWAQSPDGTLDKPFDLDEEDFRRRQPELRARERNFQIAACLVGMPEACLRAEPIDEETTFRQVEAFCRGGNPSYCTVYAQFGLRHRFAQEFEAKNGETERFLMTACRDGDPLGCLIVLDGEGSFKGVANEEALAHMEDICAYPRGREPGADNWWNDRACSAVERLVADPLRSLTVLDKACLRGRQDDACFRGAKVAAKLGLRDEVFDLIAYYCANSNARMVFLGYDMPCDQMTSRSPDDPVIWRLLADLPIGAVGEREPGLKLGRLFPDSASERSPATLEKSR